jgi:hypothetical protein
MYKKIQGMYNGNTHNEGKLEEYGFLRDCNFVETRRRLHRNNRRFCEFLRAVRSFLFQYAEFFIFLYGVGTILKKTSEKFF